MNAMLRVRCGAEHIQGGSLGELEIALVLDGGKAGKTEKLVSLRGPDVVPEDEKIDERVVVW